MNQLTTKKGDKELFENIELTAYNLDGNRTTNPDYIFDYSSNIINVMIVHDKLLLTTRDGQLRSYGLPV